MFGDPFLLHSSSSRTNIKQRKMHRLIELRRNQVHSDRDERTAHQRRQQALAARLSIRQENFSDLSQRRRFTHKTVHFLSPEQLEVTFCTNLETGLTENFASDMLAQTGPNALGRHIDISHCRIFFKNFFSRFHLVLWCCCVLCSIAYYYEYGSPDRNRDFLNITCMLVATIVGTAIYNIYLQISGLTQTSGIEKLLPNYSTVIREGHVMSVSTREVVIGDIVEMKKGQIVPADVRILECFDFETNMIALTGMSGYVDHQPVCTHVNPLESKNMAFFGCKIVNGYAKGLVVDTGDSTQIGQISRIVCELKPKPTPFSQEVSYSVTIVYRLAVVLGYLSFLLAYVSQGDKVFAVSYMLGIVLANMPEGLMMVVTMYYSLLYIFLRKQHCLVKSLRANGTLGFISILCSSKTGTLTRNRKSLSHVLCDFKVYDKKDYNEVKDPLNTELCLAATLNIEGMGTVYTKFESVMVGKLDEDFAETAVSRYMKKYRNGNEIEEQYPPVVKMRYDFKLKYRITIHESENTDYYLLIMKGDPEVILKRCSTVLTSDPNSTEMTPEVRARLMETFTKLEQSGESIIAYCNLKLPTETYPKGYVFDVHDINFPTENLQFVGAISVFDPPRQEVIEGITKLQEAGVKVIITTDDEPGTTLNIARKIGIITKTTLYDYAFDQHIAVGEVPTSVRNQYEATIITGDELRKMSSDNLKQAIRKYPEICFSRLSFRQKLKLVETYQELNHTVAYLGRCENDAPALRKADVAIAMEITGTDVCKHLSDMIVTDNNFLSIVKGIETSRNVYYNFKKTIAFLFSTITPEMLPFLSYFLLGIPLPLSLMLVVVINLGINIFPAISLAFESAEEDVMKIPPVDLNDGLVHRSLLYMAYFQIGLIEFIAGMFCYCVIYAEQGFRPISLYKLRDKWELSDDYVLDSYSQYWWYAERKQLERVGQTGYFCTICWMQLFNLIICKTRRVSISEKGMRNWALNIAIVWHIALVGLMVYTPLCNEVFGTEQLTLYHHLCAVPFCILMILIDEFRRYLLRKDYSDFVKEEISY